MRPGITAKLFPAIFLTSATAVLVMGVAERVSFRRGLLEFLNRVEAERLESLGNALAGVYVDQGGWEALRGDRAQWRGLLAHAAREPRRRLDGRDREHAPPRYLETLGRRLTLPDFRRQPVAGNPRPPPHARLEPIEVDGRTVGWLALVPARVVRDAVAL